MGQTSTLSLHQVAAMQTTISKPARTVDTRLPVGSSHAFEVLDLLADWERVQPWWDDFVEKHPRGCVFHTSQMVQAFAQTRGNKPVALASVGPNGQVTALLTSVRVQTLPPPMGRLSSRAVFYAEPLCYDHPESMKALSQLVAAHDERMAGSVLFAEVRPLFAPGSERIVLERAGYTYMKYLNYLNDVTLPEKTMWSNLHKGAQYAVRQSEKLGLVAREIDSEEAVDQLYPLLKLSYGHSGVPLADRGLFDATVRELGPLGMTKFFGVFDRERPVAMDIMLAFKDRVYLWYGGVMRSSPGSPCSLLRWFELKWAHEQGYKLCDSGGAGWPDIPYGVRDFKRKFGGELVQFGRYRKVYSPWKLALAEKVYNLKRRVFATK